MLVNFLKEESIQRILHNNYIYIQQNSPLAGLRQNPALIVFQVLKVYSLQKFIIYSLPVLLFVVLQLHYLVVNLLSCTKYLFYIPNVIYNRFVLLSPLY